MIRAERQLEDLRTLVNGLESVVVAFSGGVDSALLAKICHDVLGTKTVAVTAVSETYPEFELELARKTAAEIGIRHQIIETNELSIDEFARNPANRCYFCKSELFSKLKMIADEGSFKNIADGSNLDDIGDFRPGLRAALEYGSRSPLKEAGLTKDDVRAVSKLSGLSTWNKPAFACMSSRIPYGREITAGKIDMVVEAERFLRDIGFNDLRVRHHDTIARVEVPLGDIGRLMDPGLRQRVVERFKEIGFVYVTADIEGLRSGSMNEALPPEDDIRSASHQKPALQEQIAAPAGAGTVEPAIKSLTVFTDGASRGNPGKAGIGVAIYANYSGSHSSPTLLEEVAEYIGEATNNVAEYKALKIALERVVRYTPKRVLFKLDSELLAKQINGKYKVRSSNMIPLYNEVMGLLKKIAKWKVVHIPRAENSIADGLANDGIDAAL